MNLKTVLGWAAIAFWLWFVIVHTTDAAHIVHNIGAFLTSVARLPGQI